MKNECYTSSGGGGGRGSSGGESDLQVTQLKGGSFMYHLTLIAEETCLLTERTS